MSYSIFFFNFFKLDICTSDEHTLDPRSTHRNLYWGSARASRTRGKITLIIVILTPRYLWFLYGNMLAIYCTNSMEEIISGSELLISLVGWVGRLLWSYWLVTMTCDQVRHVLLASTTCPSASMSDCTEKLPDPKSGRDLDPDKP